MSTVNHKVGLIIASACWLLIATFASANEAPDNKIFLVRHFEKESVDTLNVQTKDPELATRGKARAQLLATFLADKTITTVFSTNYKRTIQTATPTAQQNGLTITFYNARELADFALQLQTMSTKISGNILVVGHSNTTPQLLKLLGGPDKPLSENDYGDLFYLTAGGNNQLNKNAAADSFQHVMIE